MTEDLAERKEAKRLKREAGEVLMNGDANEEVDPVSLLHGFLCSAG